MVKLCGGCRFSNSTPGACQGRWDAQQGRQRTGASPPADQNALADSPSTARSHGNNRGCVCGPPRPRARDLSQHACAPCTPPPCADSPDVFPVQAEAAFAAVARAERHATSGHAAPAPAHAHARCKLALATSSRLTDYGAAGGHSRELPTPIMEDGAEASDAADVLFLSRGMHLAVAAWQAYLTPTCGQEFRAVDGNGTRAQLLNRAYVAATYSAAILIDIVGAHGLRAPQVRALPACMARTRRRARR